MASASKNLATVAIAVSFAIVAGATSAQEQAPASEPSSPPFRASVVDNMARLQDRIIAIDEALAEIRRATLEADPTLVQRLDDLRAAAMEQIRENGLDVDALLLRLEAAKAAFRDESATQAKKAEVRAAYRRDLQILNQAQHEAMQDEELSEQRRRLESAIGVAMVAHDSRTRKLRAELEVVETEYNRLVRIKRQAAEADDQVGDG